MDSSKVLLIILDGFGIGEKNDSNAIFKANTPNLDDIFKSNPTTFLKASGLSVGLPDGQMGNSEVGHMNIGAGRIVYQDLTYINKSIEDNSFYENKEIIKTMDYVKENDSVLHIMGLLSDGGVHSHINHFLALLRMASMNKLRKVCIHVWTDGRDVSPTSAINYVDKLQTFIDEIGIGTIQTISGRFFAMDRDNHWERIKDAYNAMAFGEGGKFKNPISAIQSSYELGVTDEFIKPVVKEGYTGISEKDAIICVNFRPDRARQITRIFTGSVPNFEDYKKLRIGKYCCFSQYDKSLEDVLIAFRERHLTNTLGEYLSKNGYSQLRVAETEKYAHVTFFFNGGIEKPFSGETRSIIHSPKVKTYDLKPEMSSYEIVDEVSKNITREKHDFIVVNFANPDMVGHTGDFKATMKAVETVDRCVRDLVEHMSRAGGITVLTSDHGNAEKMMDAEGNIFTAHTTNLVPFCIIGHDCSLKKSGSLCDIAPTVLELLGIQKPCEMTGQSLLE